MVIILKRETNMQKFRHLYVGMDVCGVELYDDDYLYRLKLYCTKSYKGNNYEDIAESVDDMESEFIIRQAVLDTKAIRSIFLEEYTERKKE
jgi:Lhr-like helicase